MKNITKHAHAGSASSLIAFHDRGFNDYVAFEKEECYYRKSFEQLTDHKSQITLYDLRLERGVV